MATDQNNMTGQNGNVAMNGVSSGRTWEMTPYATARGASMQNGMTGMGSDSEKRRAKKEYRAKMKRYKAKHNEAKEVFRQITKKTPETRKEAEELYEMILARGSNAEKARAAFAVADFCWACDEKEAEKEVREEVDDFDTDED